MTGRSWGPARRARAGVRRSFQSLELFEEISVAENLHAGAGERSRFAGLRDLVWPTRPPLPPTAVSSAREFGLEQDLDRLPGELPVRAAPSRRHRPGDCVGAVGVAARRAGRRTRRQRDQRARRPRPALRRPIAAWPCCSSNTTSSSCSGSATGSWSSTSGARSPKERRREIRSDPAVIAAYLGEDDARGRRRSRWSASWRRRSRRERDRRSRLDRGRCSSAAVSPPGTARWRSCATSTCGSSRVRSWRSSDRTAPGRRRRCSPWPASSLRSRARSCSAARRPRRHCSGARAEAWGSSPKSGRSSCSSRPRRTSEWRASPRPTRSSSSRSSNRSWGARRACCRAASSRC